MCAADRTVADPPARVRQTTLAGGDSTRSDYVGALTGLGHPAVGANRQIAVVLIEKCVKALVLRRRQVEHREELAITAGCLAQPRIDQVDEILTGQLAGLEQLVYDRTEVFACRNAIA